MTVSKRSQEGFSILEILVSLSILSIVGMALSQATTAMLKARSIALYKQGATQIAFETVESYASLNPSTISAASTTDAVTRSGRAYSRTTTVSINPNGSRTVNVQVQPAREGQNGSARLSGTFTSWELS